MLRLEPSAKSSDSPPLRAWVPLAVSLLALVVFSNSLANDFVWDDNELIVENPAVHSLSNVPGYFTGHFWSQSDQPSARGYYRPMILLSYAVDYALWGSNPLGFHLTNTLFHALAAALVCMLVMKLTHSRAAAFLAGGVFAVHPVHVESVTFIAGRTDVVATAFVLLSALFFLGERERRATTLKSFLPGFFFVVALLSKEVAAVLPLLLLLGEAVVFSPAPRKKNLLLHGMYWLLLALYLAARFGALGIKPVLQDRLAPAEVLLTMPGVVMDYLRLLLVPVNLCADYAVKVQRTVSFASIGPIVVLLLVLAFTAFLIARKRASGYFAAWIFICLLPVLQIIPISVLKAERFLYLPSVGFSALVAAAVTPILSRRAGAAKRFAAAACAAVLLLFSLQTLSRSTVWKDELTLYKATAACAPDNFRVQYNLGNAYYHAGNIEGALEHTEAAFRLRPDFPQVSYNLGVICESLGRPGEAETMYRRAIELDPAYAIAHNNLAAIEFAQGNLEEARAEWSKALSLDPTLEQARQGLLLLEKNDWPERPAPHPKKID